MPPTEAPRRAVRAMAAARRKPLLSGFVAGILAAGVIAAVVLVAIRPSAQDTQLKYAALPAPCLLISAAAVDRYLPGATSSQQGLTLSSSVHGGGCTWSSIASKEDQTLTVQASVYGSATGVATARHFYQDGKPGNCRCRGYTIATQAVTGVGDEATAVFTSYDQDAAPPDASLLVRSGNADIMVSYRLSPVASASPPPAHAALLALVTAMARDVLATLANPPAARTAAPGTSASPASPAPSPGPRYGKPRSWCALVKASTLARYAPGAVTNPAAPASAPSGPLIFGNCSWGADNASIVLNIRLYPDTPSAQQSFEFDIADRQQPGTGITSDGAHAVGHLGQQAVAVYQTYHDMSGNSRAVELYVWSGNAEVDISVSGFSVIQAPPSRSAMQAADIAMARDVLAGLPT